jgi:hypothetical protein
MSKGYMYIYHEAQVEHIKYAYVILHKLSLVGYSSMSIYDEAYTNFS